MIIGSGGGCGKPKNVTKDIRIQKSKHCKPNKSQAFTFLPLVQ